MIQEKLYLSKLDDVYVSEETSSNLMEFQKDGIRFLYIQYKKEKPGVIVNDTECPERTMQIILFLMAIKHTLRKPALLLCNSINEIKILFHDLAPKFTDVSFESHIHTIDKKIYVNSLDNISTLCHHEWSVSVVFEEEFNMKLLKLLKSLKVMFKIAVVSMDLKKKLTAFMPIYEWIYPNETSKMELLISREKKMKNLIEKAIYVDSLFETIVLNRNLGKNIEQCTHRNRDVTSATAPESNVSRKNKDPTGTKTKRTNKIYHQHAAADTNTDIDNVHVKGDREYLTEKKDKKNNRSKKIKLTPDSDNNKEENINFTNSFIESKTDISAKIDIATDHLFENTAVKNSILSKFAETENSFIDSRDAENNELDIINEPSRTEYNEFTNVYEESRYNNCKDDQNTVTEGTNQTKYSVNEGLLLSNDDENDTINLRYSDEISIDEIEFKSCTKEKELNEHERIEIKDDICNKTVMTQFDTKMKNIEEKTVEKFKGSFLDSIF
ncbi:uncharacterized protein LOC105389904 [Plutella xylostella]|uniref:uncharacterized protein LOC105389904 n=1 Tax=Plutella xylostella TaxID=51655 RepID=UPI002032261E|nr:uncharacterized protein LOC105389904 [Plutella xylostella]